MRPAMLFAPLAALALLAPPALARDGYVQRDAAIHFADNGGVDDWRAAGDRTIYFKDRHRRWYRAELFAPAFDLAFTEQIGIDARPGGTLDKWGAIYVRGQRYTFRSFERAAGPPVRIKRHRS